MRGLGTAEHSSAVGARSNGFRVLRVKQQCPGCLGRRRVLRVQVLVYDERVVRAYTYRLCAHCADILTHLEPVEYKRLPQTFDEPGCY
jgi:hypothetical protein